MFEITAGLLTDVRTVLASIGLILATASFISGLQLVKIKSKIELKIHRFNGYSSITLFVVLMLWYFIKNSTGGWSLTLWLTGLSIILLKLWIVKNNKKAKKYVSWIGASLILTWLYLVYIHIPV